MNRISALAIAKHQIKDLAPIWVGFGASYLLFITLPLVFYREIKAQYNGKTNADAKAEINHEKGHH
ncbi:hypothetical protein PROFUN_08799 [Planoprotostelium fungivorum]|uniref:Uncharacterized protein n=1 Tax=Planoprotostelium fungivorum TaxID=1890364 RepID=A0A2P6MVS5_9EUKA|nr:hypothetical protein PROFUN_08799 [Planoprotostelium fungivorum]